MIDVASFAPDVIDAVLRGVADKSASRPDKENGKVDEISIEDMNAHRLKLGRWRRDVVDTVGDRRFWFMIQLSHKARAPIDHVHAFMQSDLNDKEETKKLGHHLRRLVCGRADQVLYEIESELADESKWWSTHTALLDPADHQWSVHASACLLLFYGSAFNRRVTILLKQFPFRMLLMLLAPVDHDCPTRRQIACELVSMRQKGWPEEHAEVADATTIKIAHAYFDLLVVVPNQGVLPIGLVNLLEVIDQTTKVSVQEVEGINSMIGLQTKRAPNLSLDLLSSRVSIKNSIGYTNLRQAGVHTTNDGIAL